MHPYAVLPMSHNTPQSSLTLFTPSEVAKHKNLSVTVLEFYEKHYQASSIKKEMSLDAFLYRCLGNGFTMTFGEAFFASLHKTLQLAGVPFDIVDTVVSSVC